MKNSIDFIGGDTRRSLLRMVGPLLAAMVLTMAYNLVDSLWVGNLMGETGYAALTSSTSVVLILSAIAMGSSNGAAILIAQTAGAKREAGGLISVSLALAGAFSVGVTAVLGLALRPLLSAMNTPPELFSMAYDYLSVYLLGYAAIFLYMHFTAAFRAFGDPVFQMKGMLLSTVFNAVADPLMIRGFGLRGAAWATVLSEALCLVFAVVYHRKKRLFRLTLRRADAAWVRPLLADAVPSAVQSCMPAVSSAALLLLVTGFGVTAIAAYGAAGRLEILLFYPAMAMNMALTAITGQCSGAGRTDRVRDYLRCALRLGTVFTAVLSAAVILFAGPLSRLFVDSADTAAIVQGFFRIVSVGYVLYMATSCFLGETSGLGRPGRSMALMFVYYIVVRVPLAAALVRTPLALDGVWTAVLISHIAAAALAAAQGLSLLRTKTPSRTAPKGEAA
ncbi:MATE family efflux transporter [uncultured Oscillibacter sp.]|uniref:MATE family efflux transporter n=1 Tax=uncultured Oscillibacter sp. TaxID=876091 RepID=UPI0025DB236E|nr:MATE family efflux transporter [uncultured Oscillibacter sp.]